MKFADLATLPVSPRAIRHVEELFSRRSGLTGSITQPEAEYLLNVIDYVEASNVVEIGVASGASSMFMLGMLAQKPGARLFSFDILSYFYGDSSKNVGFLALESEFNLPERFILNPGKFSAQIRQTLEQYLGISDGIVDAAFVDGSHRHPWATLDLLMLMPLMQENGQVIFHDINLPFLTGLAEDFGPGFVFEAWTGPRTVVKAGIPNIGAIELVDREKTFQAIISSLLRDWEVHPSETEAALLHSEAQRFLSDTEFAKFCDAYRTGLENHARTQLGPKS